MTTIIHALLSVSVLASCNKNSTDDDNPSVPLPPEDSPIVVTSQNPVIYYNSAEFKGNVANSKNVTTLGVLWGESMDNLKYFTETKEIKDGDYSVSVASLTAGKRYYYQHKKVTPPKSLLQSPWNCWLKIWSNNEEECYGFFYGNILQNA